MGFSDILIDVATLAKASRSVLSKCVELKYRRLDRYTSASSLGASLRRPQERVTGRPGSAAAPGRRHGGSTETYPHAAVSNDMVDSAADYPASAQAAVSSRPPPLPVPPTGGRQVRIKGGVSSRLLASSRRNPKVGRKGKPRYVPPTFRMSGLRRVSGSRSKTDVKDVVPDGTATGVFNKERWRILELNGSRTDGGRGAVTAAGAMEFKAEDEGRDAIQPKPGQDLPGLDGGKVTETRPGEDVPQTTRPQEHDRNPCPESLAATATTDSSVYGLRESRVPSSRIGRLWSYGSLAGGMLGGAIGEGLGRAFRGPGQGSIMLSAGNVERLVSKLARMRGAALKLGQMMSFQDSNMLPAPVQEVLQRVQDRADYMPAWQRDKVLVANLGPQWREGFEEFEEKPIAAASIGQVHRATLRCSGAKVAVKIQFPGVADSINSDLDNLGLLLTASRLLPKGLYLDKTIENARTELGWECDYEREARCARRYGDLLSDEQDVFLVPHVYPHVCGKQVLTMDFMEGVGVTRVKSLTQEQKDWIGAQILRLCLKEMTEFRFMQTDPNWTNFLFNAEENKLALLDFGASRDYPCGFITLYVRLLEAASRSDGHAVRTISEELGYLTGHESRTMLEAHTTSVLTLAEPFSRSSPETYDFRDQTITERVKAQIPIMVRERLAPPPEETYSLHRKLSGAFLLCARLGSRVRCREMFQDALQKARALASTTPASCP